MWLKAKVYGIIENIKINICVRLCLKDEAKCLHHLLNCLPLVLERTLSPHERTEAT